MSTPSVPEPAPRLALGRGLAITLGVAAVYFLTAHFGTFWATDGRTGTPIFPGVGAALAALLLFGRQYWPAIFVARLLAYWLAGTDRAPWLMPAIAATNAITAWTGCWLLTRWGRLDPALPRLRDVLWLGVGGGVGSSVVGATLGVSAMWLAGEIATTAYAGTWLRWWMGSTGGVLAVTPLMLAWGSGERLPRTPRYWVPLLGSVARHVARERVGLLRRPAGAGPDVDRVPGPALEQPRLRRPRRHAGPAARHDHRCGRHHHGRRRPREQLRARRPVRPPPAVRDRRVLHVPGARRRRRRTPGRTCAA